MTTKHIAETAGRFWTVSAHRAQNPLLSAPIRGRSRPGSASATGSMTLEPMNPSRAGSRVSAAIIVEEHADGRGHRGGRRGS